MADPLFPALLKFWRARSGRSQLDLALAADVSARHLSFLESGRAAPSEAMVRRLMQALDAPPQAHGDALRAAGFGHASPPADSVSPAVTWAIERMLTQQEPFPLTVLAPDCEIVRSNAAAQRLFGRFIAEPGVPATNMVDLVFDPRLLRPFIVDWPALAARMIARLHRDRLQRHADARLPALLARALAHPDVPAAWAQPDFEAENTSTLAVRLQRGELAVAFMTTITTFAAPQSVGLDELRIESYFPLDEAARVLCERLAGAAQCSVDAASSSP